MSNYVTASIDVDLDDIFSELASIEQEEFIADHLDDADIDDVTKYVAKSVTLEDVVAQYTTTEIEEWLAENAEEYGYKKEA